MGFSVRSHVLVPVAAKIATAWRVSQVACFPSFTKLHSMSMTHTRPILWPGILSTLTPSLNKGSDKLVRS